MSKINKIEVANYTSGGEFEKIMIMMVVLTRPSEEALGGSKDTRKDTSTLLLRILKNLVQPLSQFSIETDGF